MVVKQKIAGVLETAISKKKISFYGAAKIFGNIDKALSMSKSISGRYVRKSVLEHIREATAPNSKMAWTSIGFPAEIMYAFGIYPLTLEVMAGLFSTFGIASKFLDRADVSEVPNTMCSFHRVLIGMSETQFLNRPTFVGATSILCDGNLKSFSTAAENQNSPFIYLDIPHELSPSSVDYLRSQLVEATKLMSDITGKKLDQKNLAEMVRNVNRSFALARKFYALRLKDTKNLYQGHEVANFAFPMHFLLGSPRLNDILEVRCKDVESGVKRNTVYRGLHLNKNARRIMWLHIVPQYDNEMWGVIDDGVRAKIVADEYSAPYAADYDEADPLSSVAKRLIGHPSNGPIERRIEHILKIAHDFKIEGIIHYSSWGCHQAAGNAELVGRAIQNAGYKFLNLNSDPIDPRNTSAEQHKTRLEAFLES